MGTFRRAVAALLAMLVLAGCTSERLLGASSGGAPNLGAPNLPRPTETAAPLPRELWSVGADGRLTARQAANVVQALWPLRERAMATADEATLAELSTGEAAAVAGAFAAQVRIQPTMSMVHARPETSVEVNLTRASGFPRFFLAQVMTTMYAPDVADGVPAGSPYVELMVLTRASATEHWRVTLDTGFQGPTFIPFPVDATGYTQPAPGQAGAARLIPLLAAYWQHWAEHGDPPSSPPSDTFGPGYWTDQRGRSIAQVRNGTSGGPCGCRTTTTYAAVPSEGSWSFRIYDSGLLRCGSIAIQQTYEGNFWHRLYQNPARTHWDVRIPPGRYTAIRLHSLRASCVEEFVGPRLGVVGGDSETLRATGIR